MLDAQVGASLAAFYLRSAGSRAAELSKRCFNRTVSKVLKVPSRCKFSSILSQVDEKSRKMLDLDGLSLVGYSRRRLLLDRCLQIGRSRTPFIACRTAG